MKTVERIITDVSADLQDQRHRQQFTRWTKQDLVGFLNDGLSEVSGLRPEIFSVSVTIPLVPGARQYVGDGYSSITRLEENPNGTTIYTSDLELTRTYGLQRACDAKLQYDASGHVIYNVKSVALDPTDPRKFYVNPPVPDGVKHSVVATVIAYPKVYGTNNLRAELKYPPMVYVLLQDYMMGRAYQRDSESPQSHNNSVMHFTKFYRYFGVSYKAQSEYRSGNYEGRTEAGNSEKK